MTHNNKTLTVFVNLYRKNTARYWRPGKWGLFIEQGNILRSDKKVQIREQKFKWLLSETFASDKPQLESIPNFASNIKRI